MKTKNRDRLFGRLWNRTQVLSWQQAILCFALGLSLMLTRGEIVNDSLYRPSTPLQAQATGLLLTLYGTLYAFALHRRWGVVAALCAAIAIILWCVFVWFFLQSALHRVGAVTCGVLSLSQLYDVFCWYRYTILVFRHRERQRWRSVWLALQALEDRQCVWEKNWALRELGFLTATGRTLFPHKGPRDEPHTGH